MVRVNRYQWNRDICSGSFSRDGGQVVLIESFDQKISTMRIRLSRISTIISHIPDNPMGILYHVMWMLTHKPRGEIHNLGESNTVGGANLTTPPCRPTSLSIVSHRNLPIFSEINPLQNRLARLGIG
jgi:hypothetical protein